MKILYIDDNEGDQKNMDWICSNIDNIELDIIDQFSLVEQQLANNTYDLIFTERTIGTTYFYDFSHLWKDHKYYVLSKEIFTDSKLVNSPIDFLQKPLINSTFEKLIAPDEEQDELSVDYFNQIDDLGFRKEMIEMLRDDLSKTLIEIPTVANTDRKQFIHLAHNMAGKFSILGMQRTFKLGRRLERLLKNGGSDANLTKELLERLEVAIAFIEEELSKL